ncbi:MAG: hypothetical protein AAF921_01720 [Cyanobacteria bacterium P01_D01_bin.44]
MQFATPQKVQFLSRLASYCDGQGGVTEQISMPVDGVPVDGVPVDEKSVDVIETHMSWVFLTEQFVYKLKKPVRYAFLDFSTLAARYQDVQAELRLNRRLAPQVYLEVVPLMVNLQGQLQLGAGTKVIDWLVKMRRLPADGMLDVAIKTGTVEEPDLSRIVQHLAKFYQALPPVELSAMDYRCQLKSDLQTTLQALMRYANGLPGNLVSCLLNELILFLKAEPEIFNDRIRQGKVIEGHGDLRPEHICLKPDITVIDCLEFNPSLRVLDCVDELAFLALECERLGAAWVGDQILELYYRTAQDAPPERLIGFYKAYRACLRAKLAIWHMQEPGRLEAADWFERARTYLYLAEKYLPIHSTFRERQV